MPTIWPLVAALLAHQGGWDEILMVAGPVAIFALLLRSANRRAARLEEADSDDPDGQSDAGPASGPTPRNERGGPI